MTLIDDAVVLRMRRITKSFGDVHANRGIDLELGHGEIIGLLGENGAGKSTLMNILYGLISADSGEIEINGEPVSVDSPAIALAHGIGMVHQHFMLIPALTVVENLVLGAEPSTAGLLRKDAARKAVVGLSERFGLGVDPDSLVADLGVAARQRVEILRALYRGARILVLDEPTAVLSPVEADRLFAVLREMSSDGMSIILISHKLRELLALTARVLILRDGMVVANQPTLGTNAQELATLMVGRNMTLELDVTEHERTPEPVLEVADADVASDRMNPVRLAVHGGEIVGIAGVDGSGQVELVEAIAGLRPLRAGRILMSGRDVTTRSASERLALGLVYVPEDRSTEGLVGQLSVRENAIIRRQRRRSLRKFGLLSPIAVRTRATELVESSDVRPRGIDHPVSSLSGGNQQKLLIGRELSDSPDIIVVSQPTRGVDISAARQIQRRLLDARERNCAILVSSLDLDELRVLCDRIVVMFAGRMVGELSRSSATDEALGMLMAGAHE